MQTVLYGIKVSRVCQSSIPRVPWGLALRWETLLDGVPGQVAGRARLVVDVLENVAGQAAIRVADLAAALAVDRRSASVTAVAAQMAPRRRGVAVDANHHAHELEGP